MRLGIFSDDFLPFTGGMGRYLVEVTRRLPAASHLVFSPCSNRMPNHIQVRPPFHEPLRNISYSVWLHWVVDRLIERHGLSRINIQCGPGGVFLLKRKRVRLSQPATIRGGSNPPHPGAILEAGVHPLERRTYRLADRVICISEDSRAILAGATASRLPN
jgi:hypothetical protein